MVKVNLSKNEENNWPLAFTKCLPRARNGYHLTMAFQFNPHNGYVK